MAMSPKQLDVFVKVVQLGSVTAAAQALGMSQPSVSKSLALVEQQIGFTLFERANGKMVPTPEAEQVFEEAMRMQEGMARFERFLDHVRRYRFGQLRVCATPALAINILPLAAAMFRQEFPDYGLVFDMCLNNDIENAVGQGCPLWKPRSQGGKPETATRLRGRIERIWEAEKLAGNVTGENPARWTGHLEAVLPKPEKLKQVKPHAARPYAQAPALYRDLSGRTSKTARATLFTLLTAARTGEVIGMPNLREIDFNARLWLIPGDRMKAAVDHEIPLVQEALDLLADPPDEPPFGLSENTMLFFLQRDPPKGLGLPYTIHGLRSTFRDWVAEETLYSNEVAEMAIAHQIRDKAEAAYRRGKLRKKRILLMRD